MNLCTGLSQVEGEPGSAVSDLQKINKELEKLQVSDDESVFSESPSSTAPESCFGAKPRDVHLPDEQQVGQRQQSLYREARSHSPAISLNSSVPSPSSQHRAKVSFTVIQRALKIIKMLLSVCSGQFARFLFMPALQTHKRGNQSCSRSCDVTTTSFATLIN